MITRLLLSIPWGWRRGMRIVAHSEELERSYNRARNQKRKQLLVNDEVYGEKFVEKPKHIEEKKNTIFADEEGMLFIYTERDCSVQRRIKKL